MSKINRSKFFERKPFVIEEESEKGNLRTIISSRPNVMPAPQN